MWWGPRLGRTDLVFALVAVNLAYLAGVYLLTSSIGFVIEIGLRSAPAIWGREPMELSALKVAVDLLVFSLCYRRLQDANFPGWWVAAWAIFMLGLGGIPVLATIGSLVAVGGILALFFLKPTIGPNRHGADPRGWKSPEHYREQQERLKSGNI